MQPIRYTQGEPQIAYQVLGDAGLDLVFAFDWASNVELIWEHPSVERFLRRLASYARLAHDDDHEPGMPEGVQRTVVEQIQAGWGTDMALAVMAPDLANDKQAVRCRAWHLFALTS